MCTLSANFPDYDHQHPFWNRDRFDILTEAANPNCWKLDDPQWVKERKAKWKRLAGVLKSTRLGWSATDTQFYGEYFLTGKYLLLRQPEPGYYQEVSKDWSLFYLMFHPLQTEESLLVLAEILARVNSYNKEHFYQTRLRDLHETYQLYPEVLEAGMDTYVRVLWGRDEAEYRLRDWDDVTFHGVLSAVFNQAINPNFFDEVENQHRIDYCFAHVDKFDWSKFGFQDYELTQLATIAHYERIDPFRDVNPERHARAWQLVNHLRAKLNDPGCVDAELAARWADAKSDAARFWNHSRLERDYPVLGRLRYAEGELQAQRANDGLGGWYRSDRAGVLNTFAAHIDRSAWKLDDPEWMAQREKAWKKLSRAVGSPGIFLMSDGFGLEVYRNYFLRGELTGEGWNAQQLWQSLRWGIEPLLFFHPDQSEANLKKLAMELMPLLLGGELVKVPCLLVSVDFDRVDSTVQKSVFGFDIGERYRRVLSIFDEYLVPLVVIKPKRRLP